MARARYHSDKHYCEVIPQLNDTHLSYSCITLLTLFEKTIYLEFTVVFIIPIEVQLQASPLVEANKLQQVMGPNPR